MFPFYIWFLFVHMPIGPVPIMHDQSKQSSFDPRYRNTSNLEIILMDVPQPRRSLALLFEALELQLKLERILRDIHFKVADRESPVSQHTYADLSRPNKPENT